MLTEKQKELATKRKAMAEVFKKAGENLDLTKVDFAGIDAKDTKAKVRWIQERNLELNDLADEVKGLSDVKKAADDAKRAEAEEKTPASALVHPASEAKTDKKPKSFGELFIKSAAYLEHMKGQKGKESELEVEMKTLFETSAGWEPENIRTGKLVDFATRQPSLIDLIPGGQTGQSAVVYMEETTFTNNAAETAEGGAYPEGALELTEKSSPVRKIAVFIPVTDEQLEDVAQVRSYLDNRLRFMLRQRLDSQILQGDGVAPNLTGILNVAGIQTQALGADPIPDAVHKAMTKIMVTGRAQPSAVVFHPTDWEKVRLLRTADGIYIWGSPSESVAPRIWGLPVVSTDAQTLGTALVGDYTNFVQMFERRGVAVKISDSHSDFFINGKQAIRADLRLAMPTFRPAAFATVTGL